MLSIAQSHSPNPPDATQTFGELLHKDVSDFVHACADTKVFETSGPLAFQAACHNPLKPLQHPPPDVQPNSMTRHVPPHVHTHSANLILLARPDPRVLRPIPNNTVRRASFDHSLLQEVDVLPCRQPPRPGSKRRSAAMRLQIYDRIRDELSGSVVRRLTTPQRLVEVGAAGIEPGDLGRAEGVDVPATGGVYGVELCGEDCGAWRVGHWLGRGRLVGEELLDEAVLDNRGGGILGQSWEGEVVKGFAEGCGHVILSMRSGLELG